MGPIVKCCMQEWEDKTGAGLSINQELKNVYTDTSRTMQWENAFP